MTKAAVNKGLSDSTSQSFRLWTVSEQILARPVDVEVKRGCVIIDNATIIELGMSSLAHN